MSEWVLFMHPPRDDFITTMTGAERSAFDAHAAWLRQLLAEGVLIVSGPPGSIPYGTPRPTPARSRGLQGGRR